MKNQLPEVLQTHYIQVFFFSNYHLSPPQTTSFNSWLEKTWEWIEWIGEVVKFVVEKAEDVCGYFVVHFAEDIY